MLPLCSIAFHFRARGFPFPAPFGFEVNPVFVADGV